MELRQFNGIIEECLESGRGQGVYVRGHEGIGKTRLASDLLYYDFPLWGFTTAYVALALLVLAILIAVPSRRKTRGD